MWLALCFLALACWHVGFRLRRNGTACWLLVLVSLAGGAWHHLSWSTAGPQHVARYAQREYQPVRIVGRIADVPHIVPPDPQRLPTAIPQRDSSICTLDCQALISGNRTIAVSGLARLEIGGHLLHASVGDAVDVVGRFGQPGPVRNPGAFDFQRYLRNFKLLTIVRCDEPDDVRVTHSATGGWRRWQGQLRQTAESLLQTSLNERTAAVGQALLLGTRSSIPDEIRVAFAESGTTHILAISGANVAILAGMLWAVAHVAGLGRTATTALVLLGILGYTFLADAQPPVVRAALMFLAVLSGRPWHRQMPAVNSLALAALGVMILNPAHLFDLGAQLSFLAVAALIWAPTWLPARWTGASQISTFALRHDESWRDRLLRIARPVLLAQGVLAAIWLFVVPLTTARFNLIYPVGFVINILLAPLVVAVLWSGYALLVVGLLVPWAAFPFAALYDTTLSWMLSLIERSAGIPGGHYYLAGPGDGWLAGYYLCLLAVAAGLRGTALRKWGFRALGLWTVGGLGLALVPDRSTDLRCTFLSVGHGLAVVVEMPNGRTLVYDAGQLQSGDRAGETVQRALWQRRHNRVDALVISHADVDHFNGVPELARTGRISAAFAHRSLLDFEQDAVRGLSAALAHETVPLRLVSAGDCLRLDDSVLVQVVQPGALPPSRLDNANSLVLEIVYAGRRILLTGDLEQQGLDRLLEQPPRKADVLLAPHHGSLNANTRKLAAWARPDCVVASGGQGDPDERLREVYRDSTQVISTAARGAVTCTIGRHGTLRCETFLPDNFDRPTPALSAPRGGR